MGRPSQQPETESPRDSIGTGNIRISETAEDKTPAVSSFIQTIELEKYSAPDENGRVERVGMATAGEVFDKLEKYLKDNGMLPDDYFLMSHQVSEDMEVPKYVQFICQPSWGESEGIYLDIAMETANGIIDFATGKTLEDNYAAFKRMGEIATECNIMLNSNGRKIERDGISTPEYIKNVMADKKVKADNKAFVENLKNADDDIADYTEYKIYQLKDDPELHGLRFEAYKNLNDTSDPDINNYDLVYEGKIVNLPGFNVENKLNMIYEQFNLDHPDDFTGHSLSMSDVIVLNDGIRETAHYVDRFGFADVTEIFIDRNLELSNIVDRFFSDENSVIESNSGEWKIANGGYDLVAEIYHNNIPVCGIINAVGGYEVDDYQNNPDVVRTVINVLKSKNIEVIENNTIDNTLSVNEESPKPERVQEENKNIIGNTPYRSIPDKTYRTMPKDRAELVIKRFENEDIHYSGKINDNGSVTLTFSKNDLDECNKIINDVAAQQVVEEHRQKTRELYKPINSTDLDNLEAIMFDVVRGYIDDADLDIKIKDLTLYGSRSRGIENENSDIDIVVEYDGYMKEDAVFNILNEEDYHFAGIKVDFNPIHEEESGTLEEYLLRVNKYLDEQIKENEKSAEKANRDDIIGNTVFKYIPKKHYEKFDKDLGLAISAAFTELNIKHSGKINNDTVTLTMSKNDLEKCNEIIAEVKAKLEAPVAENTVEEQPTGEKTYTLPDNVKANMPDPDITIEERNDFGYTYDAMLPLTQDVAADIWENKNLPVYLLYDDGTESMAESIEDIDDHNGIFGIEAPDWEKYISSPEYKNMETAKEVASAPVTNEEHIRGIPKSIVIKALVHGSGFENGKFRIEEMYKTQKDTKQRISALKNEYGIGGYGTPTDTVGDIKGLNHDGKGLEVEWIGESGTLKGMLKWNDVDKVLKELVENDIYITSAEREKYEREMYVKAQIDLMSEGDVISVNGENFTFVRKDDGYRIEVVPEDPDSDFCYNTTLDKNTYYIDNFRLERNDFQINAAGKEEKTITEPAPQAKTDDKIYRFYHGREVGELKMMFQPNPHDFTTVYFNADTVRLAARIATENGKTDKNLFFKMIESYGNRDRVSDDTLFYMNAKNEFDNNIALMEGLSEENMRAVLNFAQTGKLEIPQVQEETVKPIVQEAAEETIESPIAEEAVEPDVNFPNTVAHRNFVHLQKLYPEIFSGEHSAEKYKGTDGMEDFSIEINGNELTLMHTFVQNGDLMYDPRIDYRIDFVLQTIQALNYEMSSMGLYQEYPENSKGQRDTNNFTATWIKNLEDQKDSRYLAWAVENFEHNGEEYGLSVYYDENGNITEMRGDDETIETYKAEKGIVEQELSLPEEEKTIHFYKYGDFYEAFGADAENAAILLDLNIATRNGEKMVGVPEFSVDNYIGKLEDEGFSVLISDTTREEYLGEDTQNKNHSEWRTTSNPIAGDMMYSVYRIIDTNDIDYSENRENAIPYIYDENMCMKIAKTLNDENITDFDSATKRADELMSELTPIYRMLTDAIQDHRTIHFKNKPKEEVYVKDARDLNIRNETLVWGEDGYQLRGDTNKGEDMYLMNFGTNKYKIFEYIISHDMELDYIEAHTKTARELSEGDIVKLPPITMVSTRGDTKTFPSEYGLVESIDDRMIHFQTYKDVELTSTVGKHAVSFDSLDRDGFEYIGIKEEKAVDHIESAKQLISEYIEAEFSTENETATADFLNLESVSLAFTTADSPRDEEIEVEAEADIINRQINVFVGDVLAKEITFDSADDFEFYLANMTFGELTYVDDDMWDKYYEVTEKEAAEKQAQAKEQPKTAENFVLTEEKMNIGSRKEQFQANIEAIKLLKQLEADKAQATPEQQDILGKYMSWGGLSDAFDETKDSWAAEYAELKEVLTPEEYKSARATVKNAHYTSPTIIDAMYRTLERLGFKGGTILEPSMGIGNFFGAMPDSLKSSQLYGVEIDELTGRFAKQLYPNANVQITGFQKTAFNSNSFDVAVGNVPFGNYRIYDNELQCHDLIHDYFFKKALDKVHPGGVVAFITSMGTMDKTNDAVRKYLAERAELLGAVRLPDTAMKNANTEVTADIIFLKKRDEVLDFEKTPELMPDWVNTKPNAEGYVVNSYFADNPEAVVGELDRVSGPFGPRIICKLKEGQDFAETLEKALSTITGSFEYDELANSVEEEIDPDYLEVSYEGHRNFCYCVVDDKIYYRENQMMIPQNFEGKKAERVKGMIEISEVLQELIRLQREDYPDEDIEKQQALLNTVYEKFTKKFDLLSKDVNKNLFKEDDTCELVTSLENLDENGELISKADIFTKRTIVPYVPPTHADTVSDALTISISEKAKVDLEYMSQLCGKTKEEILDEMQGVIFENPTTGKYETADEYLSGDVREKLRVASLMAESNPKYNINVESLTAVQPEELTPKEISVQLCSTWIPVKYYEQFMYETFDTPRRCRSENNYYGGNPFAAGKNPMTISLQYDERSATYGISNKGSSKADSYNIKVNQTYGTSRVNAYKILEDTLNNKTVVVKDYIEEPDGKKRAVVNQKETILAQEKQEELKQLFKEWIWQDPDRADELCEIYNREFNSLRPREYDGSHITFVGMNPNIELREHQKNAIAHTLYGGNTLLAHTMGAGKTFEMVASAMEAKRLGLCHKSLICVPKHIVAQFGKEFMQLYPNANILVATEKDFSKKNRRRFFSRIATGNYDAVIISHSQLEKLPLSPERRIEFVQGQIDEITAALDELRIMEGKKGFTVKQMENEKANLETKLDALIKEEKYDTNVFFEDMGFDRMFIDEAHYFKNKQFVTKMGRSVAGINASSVSQRATDLEMKIRYMDEITASRGTILSTGTPEITPYL
ncbi:MAG: DEAD/DEAH box helicase family protein [Firmicutes bacterium]|nr:DEAD/DEAH box helicase family protein [Bacillota bacterium]